MADLPNFSAGKRIPEKSGKRNFKPLAILFPYLFRYKHLGFVALFSLVLAALVMLAIPLAVRCTIDHSFSTIHENTITSRFAILLFLAIILALSSALRYYCVVTLGERVIADLRCDVFTHLATLSPGFYDRSNSGEIVSCLSSDTIQIKSSVSIALSIMVRNLIMAFGGICLMIYTSAKLAALVLLAIPAVVIPLIWLGRKVRARTRLAQDKLARANGFASEQIAAIRTLQAFNAQPEAIAKFSNLTNMGLQATRRSVSTRAFLTGLAIFLVFGSIITVLWIGSQDVWNQHMSPGTLGQFVLYSILAAAAFGQLSETGGEFAHAAGAAERLSELLEEKTEIPVPAAPRKLPHPPRGHICFNDVSFAYPSRPDTFAIKQLDFSVNPGETVAIVGPSGAGKSTVFSLLLRFYSPQKGKISIDGTDIQEATPDDIRSCIAFVAQDSAIFNNTLRQNIAFGKTDATDSEIEHAARAANALDFIMSLKDGFESQAGERGITLSGGQKQRIAIARALLRDAPILLLDEATSALDAESEQLIQSALGKLIKNRTTLVIAHRLSTVLTADRILVMENGTIIEQGTHDTLKRKGGLYTRLSKLQFS